MGKEEDTKLEQERSVAELVGCAANILTAIVEKTNDAVYIKDRAGRFLMINVHAAELFGVDPESLIGQRELLPSSVGTVVGESDDEALASTEPFSVENKIKIAGRPRFLESLKIPYRDEAGELAGVVSISRDITEKRRITEIMKNLATRFVSAYGADFFEQVCAHLCEVLSVDYAFIGQVIPAENRVKIIAGIGLGQPVDSFSYDLAGTPCRDVITKKACVYHSGVQKLFPDDKLLADMKIESFTGIPLYGRADDRIGIMVCLGLKPLEDEHMATAMMAGYSERVAAELLRMTTEEELRRKDMDIRQAYVDVLSAVTDEKLLILTEGELQEALGKTESDSFAIGSFEQLAPARSWLRAGLVEAGVPSGEMSSLILAAGEAMANGVKHGGACALSLFRQEDTIQINISDQGPGIDFSELPRATLLSGFSTKRSLGVGFSIILEICDRVLLSTGTDGTTVVLESGVRNST